MPIKTIIFDLGGVLVWTHWENVTRPLAALSGLSPEVVMERIRIGDAYYPFMRGEFDRYEFHRRMTRGLGIRLEPGDLFDMWNSILAPNEDISPLVADLAGRYRLALGSNTDELHYARGLEVLPIQSYCRQSLLSFKLGCCKPDARFFQHGLEQLAARPQECVFIDDRPENVEAARSLGIVGLQFQSIRQIEADLAQLGLL